MPLGQIAALLKETMGLDVASVGTAAIERAVRERQRACHLNDSRVYWQHLHASAAELQALIEAVVVPETWFFRDPQAFAALAGPVMEAWQRVHTDGVFRVLSAPCSTGEEPYSIAMALLDAGMPSARFQIDAVDISARVVAHAREGVYGRGAFRSAQLDFRAKHFDVVPGGHRIADGVRRQVRFRQDNMLSPAFLPGAGAYDAIFCRNVLIYFDRETQARAIDVLAGLLAPEGVLFVGSSEPGVLLNHGFSSVRIPMAFAFYKKKASASPAPPPRPAIVRSPRPVREAPRPTAVAPRSQHETAASAVPIPAGDVERARQLADQGRFVEAADCCQEDLKRRGPNADAFYLLGLVRDASGNHTEASRYYRKALYLDPNHGEAVMHLALLLEEQGRAADASVLRNRMTRLAQIDKA